MLADRLQMAASNSKFEVQAADFDGTNDYMLRGADHTGAVDSNSGVFSVFFRLDGGNGANRTFFTLIPSSQTYIATNNKLNMYWVGAVDGLWRSSTSLTSGTAWRHLLSSWDRGSATPQLYIDDTSDISIAANGSGAFDYTRGEFSTGSDNSGGSPFNGAMAEFYFAPGQYLDFSVEANRRKFITASGKPVDLGTDGSTPTGTAPIVYHSLRPGDAATVFANNKGSGGNSTITGTLDIASSSPSD